MAGDLYDEAIREARALYALSTSEAGEGVDPVELALQAGVTGAFAVMKEPDGR